MVRVEFRIAGRTIRPRQVRRGLHRAVLEAIERSIQDRVKVPRCREHAIDLTVVAAGPSVDELSFELAGCCEAAIDAGRRRLESAPRDA